MNSRWKITIIVLLVVFLVLQKNTIREILDECRFRDLLVDSVDYLWSLPQGLRFALLSAFFIWIAILIFNYLMKSKGGDGK
jgi:hypothetical protein